MKKQSIKKTISALGLLLAGLSFAQSTTENFVQSKNCLNDDCFKKTETITYFDGLGRPKQVISVKSTVSGKDLVTPITYDGFGRQVKDILPVPVDTQNSLIHSSITNENTANTYYGVSNAYSEKQFENSPLDRVLQQANAGEAWKMSSGHTQKFIYEANSGTEVKRFGTNTSTNTVNNISNTVSVPFVSSDNGGNYPAGTLYKNTVTDEDGNPVVQFTNAQGQTLLIRRTDGSQNIDTYYVYNEYNQLAFVMSPKAVKQIEANNNVITETILNELCYQYKYDGQARLVEKKLPGKDWEFMVYDKQDRLVLMQDGLLRTTTNNFETKGWIFTKYDEFGRVAYTGFFTNSATRQAMQSALNNMSANASNNEKRSDSPFNLQGIDVYYDKKGFPTGSMTLLTVNYYDTYPSGAPAVPTTVLGQYTLPQTLGNNEDASTKSLPTATYVKNIEDNNWTKTFNYYDSKGRLIASKSTNHLGGYTNKEMKLDFTGAIENTVTQHVRILGEPGVMVKERFVYDDLKRLKEHWHQVDSRPEQLLTKNTYNDLGQLINKEVGNNLQSIDYTYNIRGWLSDINPTQMTQQDLGGKLFAYKVKYTQKDGIENPDYSLFSGKNVKPKFNGNIAEVDWRSVESIGENPSLTPKRYGYVYDASNRLTAGYYQNPYNPNSRENIESLAYDVNGNITNLYRTSVLQNGIANTIDNLDYTYKGNQAIKIKDNTGNRSGYEGISGGPITYDVNGNMNVMLDKHIDNIDYNYLNLPNKLSLSFPEENRGTLITTLYRADGTKLRKVNASGFSGFGGISTTTEVTDYLDGFQYLNKTSTNPGGGGSSEMFSAQSSTDYAFEQEAFSVIERRLPPPIEKTPDLQFFPTAEGFYDYKNDQYIYQYQDHLGNVRVSFARNSAGAIELKDNNDYYPFGMNHLKTGTSYYGVGNYQNYKYNGKELQETGMYDYGARMYMADIGRWGVIDNYSENYNSLSPYNYVSGNPIKYVDINGEWIYINDEDGTKYRYHNGATQHQVDGKWANVDYSTKLSDYVLQTVAGLSYLDNSTSIGNTMIDYFDQGDGKDGKKRDINFNYTKGGSQIKFGISNIVELNVSSNKGIWTTSGHDSEYSPLYTTIAHEMGHVYGYFALGEEAQSDSRFGPNSTTAEIYGTHVENIVRAETGLPLRTNYGSIIDGVGKVLKNKSGRLIDNAGSSIYYNSNGTQISPIPSNKDVLSVNNTILQNKYNYHAAAAYYHWKRFKNRGQ